jgi:hypothetical protein
MTPFYFGCEVCRERVFEAPLGESFNHICAKCRTSEDPEVVAAVQARDAWTRQF